MGSVCYNVGCETIAALLMVLKIINKTPYEETQVYTFNSVRRV